MGCAGSNVGGFGEAEEKAGTIEVDTGPSNVPTSSRWRFSSSEKSNRSIRSHGSAPYLAASPNAYAASRASEKTRLGIFGSFCSTYTDASSDRGTRPHDTSAAGICANGFCGQQVAAGMGRFCSSYCEVKWKQDQRGIVDQEQPINGFNLRSLAPFRPGTEMKSTLVNGEALSVTSTSAGGSTASGDSSSARSSPGGELACLRAGCERPAWNGQQNEYCSEACRTPVCIRTGCGRPTQSGNPFDYCSAGCRPKGFISMTPIGSAQLCTTVGCGKPTWQKNKLCEACCTSGAHEPYSI